MIFWKIAWRNLLRNRRRSLITMATIGVGLAGVIFLWGFIDGMNGQMVTNVTRYLTGDLQIQGRGYLDEMSFETFLKDEPKVENLLRSDPAVERFAPRIVFPVLVSSQTKSRGLLAMGIDPAREPGVTTLHRTVAQGRFFLPGDVPGILIGEELAESLGVKLGDELVVLSETAFGTLGAQKQRVRGILSTGTKEVDRNLVFLPLAAMQDLLQVEGRVSTYAVNVKEQAGLIGVTGRLGSALGNSVELLTWRQLMPRLAEEIRFHEAWAYIILAVVFVVVGAGIVNTIFMGVWQRGREFGIMQALGTSRGHIVRIVAYESFILAIAGSLAGGILGLIVTGYFGRQGIDLSRYAESVQAMAGLSPVVFPEIGGGHLGLSVALVFVVSALAALYPALMATRLEPIAAIQQQRAGYWPVRKLFGMREHPRPIRQWVFVGVGIRNLFRNPRRSLISLSGIAFGMAGILFLWAFWEGYYEQMIENATGYETGHLQVSRVGFRQEFTPDYAIQDPVPLLEQVQRLPGVVGATPRIFTQALLGTGRKSTGGLLYGIDPLREPSVTSLHTVIRQGRFLTSTDRYAIVLGSRLADKLKTRVGDKVVLYAQASSGELAGGAYRVVGLLKSGVFNLDSSYAFIPLTAAQELLRLDRGINLISVRLADRWQVAKSTTALRDSLPPEVEVLPWQALLPIVTQTIDLANVMIWIILLVVFVIIAVGVMNTILMSTLERTREIGVMTAVGTKRGQVLGQIFAESFVLAVSGIAVGGLLGSAITLYTGFRGIDLTPYVGEITSIPGFAGIVRPVLLPENLFAAAVWLLGISLVVSLYPAWRASRLDPVEAIGRG